MRAGIWAAIAVGLFWVKAAAAGGALIEVSAFCTLADDRVTAVVTVFNRGDQPVHNLGLTTRLLGEEAVGRTINLLPADDFRTWELEFTPDFPAPGSYAAFILARFQDRLGQDYSAASYAWVDAGAQARSDAAAAPDQVEVLDRGVLTVNLKNASAGPREMEVRVFTPLELSAAPRVATRTLAPGDESRAAIKLSNRSGRVGAVYPALVSIAFMENGRRHQQVLTVQAVIGRPPPFFKKYQAVLWIMAAALAGAAVFGQRLKPKGSRS